MNLLSNAAKFTEAPGAIAVDCEADATCVRIHVRDTGMGIPPDRMEQIFDPFVQVDPRLARQQEGTGLGLAISRDLARGMHGEISVESTVGEGSTFTLALDRGADRRRPGAAPTVARGDEGAAIVARCRELLAHGDVHAVLGLLNARTAHRFTGLYRFAPPQLHNVALYDAEAPDVRVGTDAPMRETYCAIVGARETTLGIADARTDGRVQDHPARDAVVSYCGALVRDRQGVAVGTLCHFDVVARPVPADEIPIMEAVAALLGDAATAGVDR